MKQNIREQHGFTLLEILLAVVIIGGISIILAQSFIATTRGSTKSELVSDIKQSGDFSLKIMEQLIRSSQSVTPCIGTPGTSLQVVGNDGGTTTFGCYYDSSLNISRIASESGVNRLFLTPTNVTLGGTSCFDNRMSLRFTCTSYPGQPSSISVMFTLSQQGSPVSQIERAQASFQTTINVRN